MIVITGASGKLGRLVIEELATRVDPKTIVATARSTDKIADLADRGITVRELDYDRPETVATALADASQVLLISSSEIGDRVRQHSTVITAAADAGVKHIAYTSLLRADTSKLLAALEHRGTEEVLTTVAPTATRLRHSWYVENYTENLAPALANGALIGAAGEGRIAAATRADLAAAAATVLSDSELWGGTYELAGPAFTMAELAATVSDVSGREIAYVDMPAEQLRGALLQAGLPEPMVEFLVDADLGIAAGELDEDHAALEELAGRPLTPLRDAVAAGLS